mgnify:CR=1 FL=1
MALFEAAQTTLTYTAADAPGMGAMMSVDEQPVASSIAPAPPANNGDPRRALPKPKSDSAAKGKVTREENTKMAQEICEQVQRMMDTTVEDVEQKKTNTESAVIVGAAAKLITDILKLYPKLDMKTLYGTEDLNYLLPEHVRTKTSRQALRSFYGIVHVAARDTYPELVAARDISSLAMVRRCCHDIYLIQKAKMDTAAKMKEAAKARAAKKAVAEQAHKAWLASMTPDDRANYDKAEAAKASAKKTKAAEKRAAKATDKVKAAETHQENVVTGVGVFAQLGAKNTKPFTLTDTSYEISIKEDEKSALDDLFMQAVSDRLTINDMVDGFGPLIEDMEHKYTLLYFRDVLLNKCKTMAKKACKNPDAAANDFFEDWLAFFLVRLVGNNWKDTCHTTGGLRVPAVSDVHLQEFMKWSQEEIDKWGKDMDDPTFMRTQLDKTPLHPEMQAIFDNVSKYMVEPVMTKEIVETWNKKKMEFQARAVKESVSRSYGLEKAKGFKVSGPADILSPFGVFDHEEGDVKTAHKKMKRAETNLERAPKNTDETKLAGLKRKYNEAVEEHKEAVNALAAKKSMGLKDFFERSNGSQR